MSASTAPHAVVRVERTIPAPPRLVYRAWLDPELLQRWMAPGSMTMARAEVEEWPGGSYRIWQEDSGRDVGGFEAEFLSSSRTSAWRSAGDSSARNAPMARSSTRS